MTRRAGRSPQECRVRLAALGAAAVFGYLAGTTPSSDIATRAATAGRVDLRSAGSGNPGAANAINVLGPRWGYAVLAADITKGAAACAAGRLLADGPGAHVAGVSAVIGHCFPVWTRFKGGKGVAVSVGQCLMTFPAYFPIDLAVAGLTATRRWKDRAFASTVVASAAWIVGACVWWRRGWPNAWGPRPTAALPAAAAATSGVIVWRFAAARKRAI